MYLEFFHRWRLGFLFMCIAGILLPFFGFLALSPYSWLKDFVFSIPNRSLRHYHAGDVIPVYRSMPSTSSSQPWTLSSSRKTKDAKNVRALPSPVVSPTVRTSRDSSKGIFVSDLQHPSSTSPPQIPLSVSFPSKSADCEPCDISVGQWILDGDHYPLYQPSSCPYVDQAFRCQDNGRPDSHYLKWRWKPKDCDLERFDARRLLEKLRGKRMVFAGDSLVRNQWESMLCLLREGLTNKDHMFEIKGSQITKGKGNYAFRFPDYNATVEFHRSHFLVAEGKQVDHENNKSRPILHIDTIHSTSKKWLNADILVFTTGHWWNHGKTAKGKDYFQESDVVYKILPVMEAFRRAMNTWASWIDENLNRRQTKVFFAGYSPRHFIGGEWDSGGRCDKETAPILEESQLTGYPDKMLVIQDIVQRMKHPVQILNVTHLSEFRKDAHPSMYGESPRENLSDKSPHQDCSHWCLPGLPDIWNEVLYAYI
ncbi:hypothetical protein KP509_03G032900 [Ceratopteris richardii]|uniref:Trichome birefringence-like N-terminal domain-containing protein n=1 Tax=Ceratopteris richardii TaxID=49495 RepID=A0A8T2V1L2_CERRI|nr:hypothetical protein KP509_03G032900 [Ceratopteris richardii]